MSCPVTRDANATSPVAYAAATNYLASHRPAAGPAPAPCVRCGQTWPCTRYQRAEAVLAAPTTPAVTR